MKKISVILIALILSVNLVGCGEKETTEPDGVEITNGEEAVEVEEPEAETEIEIETEEEPVVEDSETVSQKNAVRAAKNYIDMLGFSRKGLIEQLEFDGYSNEDATYAADNITVDWKEEAVESAENYLKAMAFSRSGLIEQLEFDGYTTEEATYAADQMGL